ncbi:DHH family phosphoesterase [Bacillus rubiinfantis]|uniref:DHH family phosphoesterase n=1 Tax=Bacillus rubiinfantis TaxID=1499680 RepID=UPI0006944E3E|nr:oligoribonuclease [Bacillus rubiinfantis]
MKIFTDIDLDGFGCGIVAKLAFGEQASIAYCSYRNLNQRVEAFVNNPENDREELYITDLAVNSDIEKKLVERNKSGKHIRVIDHHVTAKHFQQYEWGLVRPEYEDGRMTCATSLFFDYLFEQKLIEENQAAMEFIELVRQYDTWEWDANDNKAAKRLNDLFYILNREQLEAEILERIQEHPEGFFFTETEDMILNLEEQKINRYILSKSKQLVQTSVDEFNIGIVHAEQHVSELGNALHLQYPHLDMVALVNVGSKKIGFRTIHEHVNVAEFALRFGGGGHPKASGADLTEMAFEKFVINVFDTPPLRNETGR